MKLKDKAAQNVGFYGLLYFAAALPFQQAWFPVYLSFAFFLTQIILDAIKGKLRYQFNLKHTLVVGFCIFTAAMAFPNPTEAGLKEINLLIPILLIALMSPALSFTRAQQNKAWLTFALALVVGFLASIIMGIPHYLEHGDTTQFFYMKLCRFLERQPHYLALYAAAAFFGIALQLDFKQLKKPMTIFQLSLMLCLLAYILMLSARAQIFAFAMVGFVTILTVFGIKGQLLKGVGFAVASLLIVALGILSSPKAKERLAKSVQGGDVMIDETGKEDPRKATWIYAIEVIKEKGVLGVGTGKATKYLHEKAIANNDAWLAERKLNYHNQYLQTIASTGIFGLILLLLWLKSYFLGALRNVNWKLCCAFMLLGISLLTESMLLRQAGVLFFAFLMLFQDATPENKLASPFWKYS